jgi:hypothetical protein
MLWLIKDARSPKLKKSGFYWRLLSAGPDNNCDFSP